MHRVSATAWVALVLTATLAAVGCQPQSRYETVNLAQQQEDALQERDAEIARLRAENRVLQEEQARAQLRAAEKEQEVAAAERERNAYRQAYEKANSLLKDMARQPVRMGGGGGPLPEQVALEIEAVGRQHPNLFEFERESGRLRFAGDITFDSGSNLVRPDARTALRQLAAILGGEAGRAVTVTIVGHTDSVPVRKPATIALLKGLGKSPDNQGLSDARAEAVAEVLTAGGVAASRIATQGRGSSEPIADNGTAQGRAQNRRVEIYLK